MDIKVILKVSESDPHKEFYVTLSTKSKKEIVSNILDEWIEYAEGTDDHNDQIKVYKKEKKKLEETGKKSTKKSVKDDYSILHSKFRNGLPDHYAATHSRLMESDCDGELLFIDNISSYYYHYFLFSEEEWNTKEDLKFTFHEH